MSCEFSLEHFEKTLKRALDKGYTFLTLSEYIESEKHPEELILLRHDIDYSTEDMMRMAEIEDKLGVKSTIFVRLHSRFYNPLDRDSFKKIKKLKETNHELGLHFEPVFAEKNGIDIEDLLIKDLKILEQTFDVRVGGIGTHLETRCSLKFQDKLEWIRLEFSRNAERSIVRYPADSRCLPQAFPDLFEDYVYLRDTNAEWIDGSLCEAVSKEDFIYVLIHPVWWNPENLEKKEEIIKKLGEGY